MLAWYRDLLVWNLTGDEQLLAGGLPGPPPSRGPPRAWTRRRRRRASPASGGARALRMNAEFHTVMENLLVQLSAGTGE